MHCIVYKYLIHTTYNARLVIHYNTVGIQTMF